MKIQKRCMAAVLVFVMLLGCFATETAFAQGETDIVIKIGGKEYDAVFYGSKASGELLAKMPFQVKMSELNGNEKYRYLNDSFTEDEQNIGQIHAGDIMLYGSDCLVVFYKSFRTTYQYTKIGKITNPNGLESAVGNGSVKVSFSKASNRNNSSVSLTKKTLTLRPGKSKKIKLSGAKAGKVKWSTSNRKVAVVKGGKITAKKTGKAVITAKYKGKKYKCKVTVKTAKK